MLRSKISKMFSKAAVGVAALAMVCAMVPMAMATTNPSAGTNDTSTITVTWTDEGTRYTCDVDLAALVSEADDSHDIFATQYSMGGWNVLATNESVSIADIIQAAAIDKGSSAADVWNEDSTLTVCTEDYPEGYGDYSYSDMMYKLPFYSDTTSSSLGSDVYMEYSARIGLTYQSTGVSGTALSTLMGLNFSNPKTYNRLIFGYVDGESTGNHFPKYVTALEIK